MPTTQLQHVVCRTVQRTYNTECNHAAAATTMTNTTTTTVAAAAATTTTTTTTTTITTFLRAAVTNRLVVPSVRLSTVGSRAFLAAAPRIWNSLPEHVVTAATLQSFKKHWKTF